MKAREVRKLARASEHRERKAAKRRGIVGTADVLAQLVIQLRDGKQHEISGSACLPQVALYSAGHRKCENITAR
ncbi:hypothetical protein [Pectobacterium parmentieri]|uniref:transcriptional antitermination N peptide n=1 Tax=Pectobacterium parmentieri TaxID=1905730 RepID=UPI000EADE47D|nr:hypothetical protein [Pectobacterium parmentieri]AYH33263.1 hypothetical protein C5E19_17445 [Pectobacterium parmentieri]